MKFEIRNLGVVVRYQYCVSLHAWSIIAAFTIQLMSTTVTGMHIESVDQDPTVGKNRNMGRPGFLTYTREDACYITHSSATASEIIISLIIECQPALLRPMTMETRCSKVIVPNYSKKKPAEDKLVPPLWGTREENVCLSRIICSRCCTRRHLRFHVENCQQADQKQLTGR